MDPEVCVSMYREFGCARERRKGGGGGGGGAGAGEEGVIAYCNSPDIPSFARPSREDHGDGFALTVDEVVAGGRRACGCEGW